MRTQRQLEKRGAIRRARAWLWVPLLLLGAGQYAAAAEDARYPTKPVRWIIPFPVGGSIDIVGRIVGQKLFETWGRQVVVDNRPGMGGRIGTQLGAAALPDGYTHTLTINTALTSDNILSGKSGLDTERAFAPITVVAGTSQLLLVNPSLPVKSVQEFIAFVKARPGKLNYGSSGPGGSLHLAMELLKFRTGIDIVHVPYKGGPPAALPLVKSGKLRALGVSTAKRSPLLPEVPAVAESGVAGFDTSVWYGLLAPAGTSKAIVSKVHRDIIAALTDAEVRKLLLNAGAEPVGNSPQEFSRLVREETASWAKVIKAANIRVD